ncbi:MAG: ADP-ribosylglycohydrolase family protein, partial [Thermoleophilia bacterium]|nr:ADP-ribosylglycohydrolase family protein [Thermoleophilia bacterium]
MVQHDVPREATPSADSLRIGEASVPGTGGAVGMTLCPGKKGPSTRSGRVWDRDLDADLERIRRWGAEAVVTLIEQHELDMLKVGHMGEAVPATGLRWFHLPIVDTHAPDGPFEVRWNESGPQLRAILAAGGRVLLHCRGGLGRTGVVAARLLMEFGVPVEDAMRTVREARRHTIETAVQERYLRGLARSPGGVAAAPAPFLAEPWPPAPSRVDPAHFGGCLLGGAVGDALGAPVEFMSFDQIVARFGPAGIDDYAPAYGRLGAVTDDTQMMLFTAEGLLEVAPAAGRPDAAGHPDVTSAVHRAYLRWLITQDGPTLPLSGEDGIDALAGLLGVPELHSRRAPGNTCLSALRSARMGTV